VISTPTLARSDPLTNLLGLIKGTSTQTLDGIATAGSPVTLFDGEIVLGTTTADASGTWTFTSPMLKEGQHSISVRATYAQGCHRRALRQPDSRGVIPKKTSHC
jgi:hypothetical protein